MQIKKAVILAAGLGTRMLPATKAVPKELLPIVDKPAIQYLVEEAAASGITDILIIISRGKTLIEDHFDRSPELEQKLIDGGSAKKEMLQQVLGISSLANIYFIRQPIMNGTGGAVRMAKEFTADEPFALMYGDDVIINDNNYPVLKQLIDSYNIYNKGIAGVQKVSEEAIQKYSTMKVKHIEGRNYELTDMIEKPNKDQIFSLFSILGRIILPANIYSYIERTPRGCNNEFQITDAMKALAQTEGMIAYDFDGKRYDMGNKLGVMKAQVEMALKHPTIGSEFKEYLKEITKDL